MGNNLFEESIYVPVVIAFTPNYLVPAAACLHSMFLNTGQSSRFHIICLLSEDLPESIKLAIKSIGGEKSQYSFINLQGQLEHIKVDPVYSVATLYRLLLPDLLPQYDKVLYLDCDIIVRNDLAKVYNSTDIGDNYLGAVYEAALDFQEAHFLEIGCDPATYFNAGFLIMNLKLLRQNNMCDKFLDMLNTNKLEFWDQDVLNVLCKDRIYPLPPIYNSIRTFFLPQYKHFFLKRYTETEWRAVQDHGTIHYTGIKPWHSFTVEFKVWWQYYEQLPFEIKRTYNPDKRAFILYKIYDTIVGRWLFEQLQHLYRKIKYKRTFR
jgi:lipopolysaccharide biosynthesis glycosyltransferase